MQWDDKKGKYVKPFTKKRIELLPHLYLEGYRLYWDIKPYYYNDEELEELFELDLDFSNWSCSSHSKRNYKLFEWCNETKKYKPYPYQKYLNMVLSVLPYIPLTGLILGVII